MGVVIELPFRIEILYYIAIIIYYNFFPLKCEWGFMRFGEA